jgi:hypothetical protein
MFRTITSGTAVLLALAGLAGCGDDDDTTVDMGDGSDSGPVEAVCFSGAPNPDELTLPCCYRESNADRPDQPEFRVTNLQIDSPPALSNRAVLMILAGAVEDERFNWLLQATVDGTDVTVQTGYGEYDETTSVYNFVDGVAPTDGGGDPDRWNPITIEGTLDGDTFTAPPVAGSFTVPIFSETGDELDLELPLNSFEVISATFSEDRTCIGERTATRDTFGPTTYATAGDVRTYITRADAEISFVTQLNTTLCNLISGGTCTCPADNPDCVVEPPAEWNTPPTAQCDADGVCVACDFDTEGDTCNAWEILGSFAAAGVEIEGGA